MRMKQYYDKAHTPRFFHAGDMVNLRLHRGYTLPSLVGRNKKLGQPFIGLIRILARIGRLAYRLDIPATWKIHDVASIAHLEPASRGEDDPYRRPRPTQPEAVIVDGTEEFELECLLRKRTYRKGRGFTTKYHVHWILLHQQVHSGSQHPFHTLLKHHRQDWELVLGNHL